MRIRFLCLESFRALRPRRRLCRRICWRITSAVSWEGTTPVALTSVFDALVSDCLESFRALRLRRRLSRRICWGITSVVSWEGTASGALTAVLDALVSDSGTIIIRSVTLRAFKYLSVNTLSNLPTAFASLLHLAVRQCRFDI